MKNWFPFMSVRTLSKSKTIQYPRLSLSAQYCAKIWYFFSFLQEWKTYKNRNNFFQKNVWKKPSPSVNRLNRLTYRPLRHWWSTEGLGCFCLFPCIHRFLGWFHSRYRIFYRRIRLSGFISTMVGMHVILSIHWYRMMVWQISEILVKQLVLSCKLSCFMP